MSQNKKPRLSLKVAMESVFENDMLLEMILERTISSNLGFGTLDMGPAHSFSTIDVRNCRLVSNTWMITISSIHRRVNVPLFHLKLTNDNTSGLLAEGKTRSRRKRRTLIEKFLANMARWGLDDSTATKFPRFHLELSPSFFWVADSKVYQHLFQFMMEYGPSAMTEFSFKFFRNKFVYIPTSFPSFNFKNLRQSNIIIERVAWSFIPMLQSILQNSPKLEELDMTSCSCVVPYSLSSQVNQVIASVSSLCPYFIRLPKKIRKIYLNSTVDSCSCFFRIPTNHLEHLETLSLSASSCLIRQVDDMLAFLAGNLRKLDFVGFTSCIYVGSRQYQLTFPILPTVTTLTVNMPWEVKRGGGSKRFSYEHNFPCLKQLQMVHCNPDLFHSLLLEKTSQTVEICRAVLVQPHTHAETGGYRYTSPRLDSTKAPLLQSIKTAFPNLTHLEFGVTGGYTSALEYVFANLTTLKALTIFIEANAKFWTTVHWDSVFTGLPSVACRSMSGNPQYWDGVDWPDDVACPSIRKLTNLETLYLVETTYPSCRVFGGDERGSSNHTSCNFECDNLPVIPYSFTELSFHFSFFRMSKLKHLGVTRGFHPPENIMKKWEEDKGTRIKMIKAPKLFHLVVDKFSLLENSWFLT